MIVYIIIINDLIAVETVAYDNVINHVFLTYVTDSHRKSCLAIIMSDVTTISSGNCYIKRIIL